jgi:L-2-hydroxyglutarate oxidase
MNDGKLVNGFLIVKGQCSIDACNAPFPDATSFIEIGKSSVEQIPE